MSEDQIEVRYRHGGQGNPRITLLTMSPRVAHPDVVAAAGELAPFVAAAADDLDREGRLPTAIIDRLSGADLFQLYLPASAGGPEVDPVSALLATEVVARADGSVAWCAHVSSANAWALATLAPETVSAMAATAAGPGRADRGGGAPPSGATWRLSGSARPLGRAVRVDGGYVVNGRWDFASNCLHAEWYCGTCVVSDDPRRRGRAMFFPMSDVTVIDTWRVAGLRGTGSHDVAVHDLFVPDTHVSAGRHLAGQRGRLFHPRLTMVVNWALTAGVALGIARGALDAFGALSGQTTAQLTDTPLRDRADVQRAVGRAEATLGAARSYCLQAVADAWEADDDRLDGAVVAARLAITHAMHTAVDVVDLLFHAGGTRSIFNQHGLERRFRDAHVALQHGAGSPAHYEAGGRIALGLPAGAPFW
jgi:alkylation response protein AidB-like acyl-CoA dehydrogenase